MIHQYKSNGYNIVMDINTVAIHVVDDVVYDIIELYEDYRSLRSWKCLLQSIEGRYRRSF